MHARSRPIGVAIAALVLAACGSIIGIDDRSLDPGEEIDAGGLDGVAPPADARSDTAVDSTTPSDTGADVAPVLTKPTCGPTPACAGTEVCCVDRNIGGYNYKCAATGTCPTGVAGSYRTLTLACTKASDCGTGRVCCYKGPSGGQPGQGKATCESSCGYDISGDTIEITLCDPKAGAGACNQGTCVAFSSLLPSPPYGWCQH